jgi:RNA polymerase sigma-70 factor (ECF subfamily)
VETTVLDIHSELVKLSAVGDSKAQYQLYKLYAKAMLNVSFRMMHNVEDAEDMLQEAFTEAFKKLKYFRFEATFGSWLKKIVVNRCMNELRRRKTNLQFFEDMQLFEQRTEEEMLLPELSVDNVKRAMESLPGGSRMVFSLHVLEGYDHNEISEILKISVSTSKSQYMRARLQVKQLLIQQGYEN